MIMIFHSFLQFYVQKSLHLDRILLSGAHAEIFIQSGQNGPQML